MDHRQWVVYLIRCSDGSLYCGITNNLTSRMLTHNSGSGAKYTRSRRPVEIVASSPVMTKSDALKLEYRIKQIPACNKIFELTKGENEMDKKFKNELKAVSKKIMVLAKSVEKMIATLSKAEMSKPSKKAVAKKPVIKKNTAPTAGNTVFGIIKRSKKGVDTTALMKKTGFNAKKIQNNIFKLKKQGKIKSEVKGIYLSN